MRSQLVALATAMAAANPVGAYEQATHASITQAALLESGFAGPPGWAVGPAYAHLGLGGYRPLGSADKYFEFVGTLSGLAMYERKIQSFERDILDSLEISWTSVPLQAWVMFGAIREDDNPGEDPPTPQDVSTGLLRPLHHFFDPYFNRALTIPDPNYGDALKSVDWALGTKDAFAKPNEPADPRRNHFTTLDAREAMFRAITSKAKTETGFVDLASTSAAQSERDRQLYWTTALRAIGDVLHLNQDMAQPQHTRDERHSGLYCAGTWFCPLGHSSVYEKYIKARTLKLNAFTAGAPYSSPVRIQPTSIPLASTAVPNFSRYSDYWSTGPGAASLLGKGLADYSNHGFFTPAKNVGSVEYPSPPSNLANYAITTEIPLRWDASVSADLTPVAVYRGSVVDAFAGHTDIGVPLTTFSVWDQFLIKKSATPTYTLNRLNYDAMANLLLPRAVAYSAGLINFFFRGKIDISLPDEGVFAVSDHGIGSGFKKLRIKIKNSTEIFQDAQGNPQLQTMTGGTFFAVIRYHKDRQYADTLDTVVGVDPCDGESTVINLAKADATTQCRDGVEQIVVSEPLTGESLSYTEEKTVTFNFAGTPIPYAMTDVVLQVVYRGPLGSEADAVAVGTLDISEPTYFTYQNASDYVHIGEHVHTRSEINSSPELLSLVRPQYCVDYRQSPPRLFDACFRQFDLDLVVGFGDISTPLAEARGIPPRHLMRIVYLTTADEAAGAAAKRAERRKLQATTLRHTEGKALLNQQGSCLPFDPFDIPPRHSQLTMLSTTEPSYRLGLFSSLRGVNGWFSTSCVVNGDQSEPGEWDDRNTTMTELDKDTDEVQPVSVTIMQQYQ